MAISNKTRKLLWGNSGSRCAICRTKLVIEKTPYDSESVIGEECHIVSGRINGPRYRNDYPIDKIDSYDNLILLCSIHHKNVDDQYATFTEKVLKEIKNNHCNWVNERLTEVPKQKEITIRRKSENIPVNMYLISSGKEFIDYFKGSLAFTYNYDEKLSENASAIVSMLFKQIDFYDCICDEFNVGDEIEFAMEFSNLLIDLEREGYLFFAATEEQYMYIDDKMDSPWSICHLLIIQKNDEKIEYVKIEK